MRNYKLGIFSNVKIIDKGYLAVKESRWQDLLLSRKKW
jgi:hypothetical protein